MLTGVLAGILPMLPENIRAIVETLPAATENMLEEIRIRQDRPLALGLSGNSLFLTSRGEITDQAGEAYRVTGTDLERLVQLISNSSFYAIEEELRQGFITLPGGHRVGITGKVLLEEGQVRTIKHISCCNIRVSREVFGVAGKLLPHLLKQATPLFRHCGLNGESPCFSHTLLVSPPGCGKTTLLRDLIRQLSNGVPDLHLAGLTVGVVDERSEIAGCYKGVPQLDVGPRTDVLDACPKGAGMMLLLRSMNPRIIAVDEIGREEDATAIREVLNAGVKVLATAHGSDLAELVERPVLGRVIRSQMFQRIVFLGRSRGVGTIEEIFDGRTLRSVEPQKC